MSGYDGLIDALLEYLEKSDDTGGGPAAAACGGSEVLNGFYHPGTREHHGRCVGKCCHCQKRCGGGHQDKSHCFGDCKWTCCGQTGRNTSWPGCTSAAEAKRKQEEAVAAAGAKRKEDECKKRETEEKKRKDEEMVHAASDNDDSDSEDMRIAMALSISLVRNEEQGAGAGAQWSCTVCTLLNDSDRTHCIACGSLPSAGANRPSTFYHATNLKAALAIQDTGFRILPGSGGCLGPGIYCTTTLIKAFDYLKCEHGGIIFELNVDLRRCKILHPDDPQMKTWQQHYDSAWHPTGAVNGVEEGKEENWVKDPRRIKIVRPIAGHTGKLFAAV